MVNTGKQIIKNFKRKFLFGGGLLPISIPSVVSKSTNTIRRRLYDNVIPFGYHNPVKRVASAILLDRPYFNQEIPDAGNYDALDELWATYLNIPKDKRHYDSVLKKSQYKPTKSKDKNSTYYALPLSKEDKQDIIEHSYAEDLRPVFYRDNKGMNPELGEFTISRGHDSKGDYVSYYDKWDLNPLRGITNVGNEVTNFLGLDKLGDLSLGIGKPVEVYDRIYLDDYYGLKTPTHSAYLPEITIKGNNKSLKGKY